jgi:hypothetical protein
LLTLSITISEKDTYFEKKSSRRVSHSQFVVIDDKNKLFATSVTQMIRHLVVNVFTFDSTPTVIPALPSYHPRCVRVCLDEAELGALNLNQGKHVGDFENCEREVRSI